MEASQSRQRLVVRSGAESLAALEARLTTSGPVRDAATAEGLALVGERAASLAAGRTPVGSRRLPTLPGSSCLHHVEAAPGSVMLGAFELAAGSAQQALDLTLAGHRLSARLGRPGLLSLDHELAEGLAIVEPPDAETIAECLAPDPESAPIDVHDPDRVVALAADCLATLAASTGREHGLVHREGGPEASWALIATGDELAPARQVLAALAEVGEVGLLVSPCLVRPLPAGELAEALSGVRRVFVVEREAGHSGLRAAVRLALPPRIAVGGLVASDGPSLLQALVAALGATAAAAAAAQAQLAPATGLPHRLLAAPDGPWARELTRRVLADLGRSLSLRVDHRSRSHLGASVLAWGDGSPAAAGSGSDLLIASGVSLLESQGALALVRPGGDVLVLADAADERGLARLLPKPVRTALLEQRLGCHWLGLADGARAAERLLEAARWLAAGSPADAGRPDGLHSLSRTALEAAIATEEVDFRARPKGPHWPAAAAADPDPALLARWVRRLERFHRSGTDGSEPLLQPAAQPALLVGLQQELAAGGTHPFVLLRRGDEQPQTIGVRALAELIDDALGEIERAGRDPRALAQARRAMLQHAGRVLGEHRGRLGARRLIAEAGDRLRQELKLSESDDARLCEDVAALVAAAPEQAQAFSLHSETPVCLYLEVLEAVREPLLARFRHELEGLRDRLRDLLRLDRLASEEGRAPASLAAHLGAGADQLLDAGALSRTLPKEPASGRLEDARRDRIEAALAAIEVWLEKGEEQARPLLLHAPETPLPALAVRALVHDDPLSAAVGCFDGLAERATSLHRAVRTARLELAGRYQAERDDRQLAELSWEGMHADEVALLPPVAVVTTGRRLRRRGQAALSELLRSSRPVHVLVLDEVAVADEAEDLSLFHLDLGQLVMAHREVFAVSSTLARPDAFVQRLGRMVRATRPGVALVHMACPELAPLRPLLAEAALLGRACPDFVYDPEAGPSWADRFDVEGNPGPDQAWPMRSLRGLRDEQEEAIEVAFTFADSVALEPAYQRHLLAMPTLAWDEERHHPLAEWLARLEAGSESPGLPYVWIVDDAGRLQRAVVTRALALASRDRLRGWHVLQELAGFENAHVERAVGAAVEALRGESERARSALEQQHAEALGQAHEAGAREALQRLAEALVRGEAGALRAVATGGAAPAARRSLPAPDAGALAEARGGEAEEAAPEAQEVDEEPILDEPYVDSALCTTCNECTNLNGQLFVYNADKQAYIADASAGTFDELVRAAEKCPARCIHPGSPRPGDATATAELIQRAAAFR